MLDIEQTDIIVAGAGPVGMIAAVALARAGFNVSLIGPEPRDDRRTTALMNPAMEFLAEIGVPDFPDATTAPLAVMRIVDATSRLVRSAPVTFRAAEIGETQFGTNVPNTVLNAALSDTVASKTGIARSTASVAGWEIGPATVTAVLDDGTRVTAPLAVAADGRNSPARAAAGITTRTHDYPQAALVVNFSHSRPHADTSTELHTETGPFTQVPLPGQRSSLVWVVAPASADAMMALDDAALSLRIEERMQSMLGKLSVEPGRQVYRLSAAFPASVAQSRVALVGEAAHVFPPIGAQGMNLGIRDVAELVRVTSGNRADPGSEAALAAYRGARRGDILARSSAVNVLNRTLLSDFLPAQLARGAGLAVLGSVAPLRALFMREGMRPGSGFASALSAGRKEIGRQGA